jgi:hypothetical protein
MEAKKLLPNARYFAFTATPKSKTLELFGEPYQDSGTVTHRPFHSYTMKQPSTRDLFSTYSKAIRRSTAITSW